MLVLGQDKAREGGTDVNQRGIIDALKTIVVSIPLLSCTGLVSSRPIELNYPSGGRTGMAYSLPKGQIMLTARRGPVDIAALLTAQAAAEKAFADATKAPAGGSPPDPSSPAVVAATASRDAAQANLDVLAPKNASGDRVPAMQEVVTLTALPFVPDPTARYVADFNHRPWRDDNLHLSMTNGLLTSSSLVSQDQTPAAVASIASTIVSLTSALSPLGSLKSMSVNSFMAEPRAAAPSVNCQYSLTEVFDPAIEAEVARVNDSLAVKRRYDRYLRIRVDIPGTAWGRPSAQFPVFLQSTPSHPAPPTWSGTAEDGLFYRMATPVVVTADYDSRATDQNSSCQIASIPTVTPVNVIVPDTRLGQERRVEATAGWLTTTTLGLTFSNGMLTDRSVQRPSEILALVGIPANIINQYMTILTNFLQFRVNYATSDATIATQRANALTAQINQLQSLAQIATAGTLGDAKGQLALLQIQQQLQTLKNQLALPATP